MARFSVDQAPSKYYKFAFCDGLEALSVNNHQTPFPAHFHPTFNITLVYAGTFNTQLTDKMVLAPSGNILITNPEEIHANPFPKDSSVSFFTFYISRSFLEYCNLGKPVVFRQNAIDDAASFTSLHLLSLKLVMGHDFLVLENELRITLSALAAKYGSEHPREPAGEHLLFREMLSDYDFEKFSLADAAKTFGIDKYKFIRLFKAQTGLTPNNYFIYRRIEKSKAMLAEGQDLLSIAIDLGFYDAAHYCNHFKKFTGVSPTGYTGG
ncbi:MAG: helix-turn-helix transcriptional regulator [Bacteroidetes bacterium]|nr:helix-turn-helix transcriptional regulator [Bacteroidota bacterium]